MSISQKPTHQFVKGFLEVLDDYIDQNPSSGNSISLTRHSIGENGRLLYLEGTTTSISAASRQGLVYLEMNRSVAMTSWDGNPDTVLKIRQENNVNNTNARGALRCIDAMARNDDANAICANIHTVYLTAENTSDINTECADMQVLQLIMSNQGVVGTNLYGLRVLENSEGTIPTDTVGIWVTTSANAPAAGTRLAAFKATGGAAGAAWSYGIYMNGTITSLIYADSTTTNFAAFSADAKGGLTLGATMTKSPEAVAEDGYLTIIVGATSYQIPFYAA